MEEFFKVVANLGFPIAVSGYLLWRMEKKLDALEETLNKLVLAITKLKGRQR